ncbi:hypothetical protein SASPL_148318 [Salvia splendens]|uniref:BED-type domain-containing protein n=1 Tax=Salvia splendens TaxID=180675 RepID=A0A8X8W9I3_SALSN|nr:hypothetical protein SASPL_148318 [Salvia splendens]
MKDSSPTVNIENVEILGDSKPKKRQKTSDVWNNFTNEEPDKNGKNVKCNHCLQRWKYEGTKMGTSTFSRHMLVCKKKPNFGIVGAMLLNHDGKLKKKSVDASSIKIPQSSGSSNSKVGEFKFMEGGVRKALRMKSRVLAGYKSYKGLTSDTKSTLDVYLEDLPMDEDAEIDLLKYWKEKSSRFGVLARMAYGDSEDDEEEANAQAEVSKLIDLEECHSNI